MELYKIVANTTPKYKLKPPSQAISAAIDHVKV
jgi:hypothetical protein